MSGDRSSILKLTGSWSGTYLGTETNRRGGITFLIQVTGDSAFGDVLMDIPPGVPNIRPADDPRVHQLHSRGPRLLTIRFVDISGGGIEGVLEPYVAPDCDCEVVTRFTGRVVGDTIQGTFVTRGRLIAPQTGTWSATRDK
jgi:hypothetical protein